MQAEFPNSKLNGIFAKDHRSLLHIIYQNKPPVQTLMEACGICSERVGRPMTAPGAEGTRGQDGRQQQEAKPTSICALCSAPTLPASRFLETRSVCAQNLLSCWLVCEFYQDLTHVYFSLSTEIRAFVQEKSDSKRAVPASPGAGCVSGLP